MNLLIVGNDDPLASVLLGTLVSSSASSKASGCMSLDTSSSLPSSVW